MFEGKAEGAQEEANAPTGMREDRQPDSASESDAGEAPDILPPLYRDLLQSRGRLEEEVYRRTLALATLAHEAKNPLAIIMGYVELLLTEKAGPLTERQRKILQDALANCGRLQKLTQDFLSYGALEARGAASQANFVAGDLNACLSEVCGYWLSRFSAKGVALYFMASPELKSFEFDYYKVQQVVSNLLENSLKFTPQGGTVWITLEPHMWERRSHQSPGPRLDKRRESSTDANMVRVTVADSGVGIAPEFHQEVFEDFYRVPGTEDQKQGAGLGLAISRRLIQLHGGKIWVESEAGAGSKFCFLLPLRRPET